MHVNMVRSRSSAFTTMFKCPIGIIDRGHWTSYPDPTLRLEGGVSVRDYWACAMFASINFRTFDLINLDNIVMAESSRSRLLGGISEEKVADSAVQDVANKVRLIVCIYDSATD